MKNLYYVVMVSTALLMAGCSQGIYDQGRAQTNGMTRTFADSASMSMETTDAKNQDSTALRRLESVKWNSVNHELTWDVSRGVEKGGKYQPRSNDHYEINMDDATMTVNGQTRRFSAQEAANVRTLMDFISKYALESTVWWENGEGQPLNGKGDNEVKPERTVPTRPPDAQEKPDFSKPKPIRIANILSSFE